MTPEESYIQQVLERLPAGPLRQQIGLELRASIADRLERGGSVEDALRQLGDPIALADSYLAAVPLVSAPLGRRTAAKLFDICLFVSIPLTLVFFALRVPDSSNMFSELAAHPPLFYTMLIAIVSVKTAFGLYMILAEHSSGQTLGKRLFGLQVVRESGGRISLGQSFLRQLPLFVEIFVVDILFALFSEKKQRGFEMISRTRVVDARRLAMPRTA